MQMEDLENWLTGVGSERARRGTECWRVSRVGTTVPRLGPRPADRVRDPGPRILRTWLNRLGDNGRFSPYRIWRER